LNLHPGVLSECEYICFKDQAKFLPGFQGLVKLAIQSGTVNSVSANVVWEADVFDFQEGSEPFLKHKKFLGPRDKRGERVCVYAVAALREGGSKFVVMTNEEVMNIKARSKAKNSEFSPWNSSIDDEDQMFCKTAVKRLSKLLLKSTKAINFAHAVALDNAAEVPSDKDSSLSLPVFTEDEYE